MVYGILSHKESVVMHNELSIEKGTLENASETLRFIQNVRTQIGLRALTADFVVGKWQGWFNVWLDLKNDPSETAQKLLNTVLNNGAGHPLNDPQLFGKEISELAERIGDILMDAHGYTRAEILSRYAHSVAPANLCVYIRLHKIRVGIYLRPLVGDAAGGDCREVPHTEPERRIRILRAGADDLSGRRRSTRRCWHGRMRSSVMFIP